MNQIALSILEYEETDLADLKRMAQRIVPSPLMTRDGKSAARQIAFFAGRAALAHALEKLLWRGTVIPDSEFGFLKANPAPKMPPLFVNISHTANLAVAVVASSPVGVDVEHRQRDAAKAVSRILSTSEKVFLGGAPVIVEGTPVTVEVALWSAKEAVSKAIGLGISFGMQAFEIGLQHPKICDVTIHRAGPLIVERPGVKFTIYKDFLISVCADKEVLESGFSRRVLSGGMLGTGDDSGS